jgi:hypothetical protein
LISLEMVGCSLGGRSVPGLPGFSWYKIPKWGKIYQISMNYTKCPWNITEDRKMVQVSIKYSNIFHCKNLQNLPKFGFLVWKQTIWQPWSVLRPHIVH